MTIYLVSYDLISPGQNYQKVHEEIKNCSSNGWAHALESTWLIDTRLNAETIRDRVLKVMDANDKILVIQVTRDAAAYNLPDDVWKWLETKL